MQYLTEKTNYTMTKTIYHPPQYNAQMLCISNNCLQQIFVNG